jgi:hypothetical protein
MSWQFSSENITKAWQDFETVAERTIYDQVTGAIKSTAEGLGVDTSVPKQVQPKGSQESEQNAFVMASFDWAPILIGAAVIGGFFLLKKKSGRVS